MIAVPFERLCSALGTEITSELAASPDAGALWRFLLQREEQPLAVHALRDGAVQVRMRTVLDWWADVPVAAAGGEVTHHAIPRGRQLLVRDGDEVAAGQVLCCGEASAAAVLGVLGTEATVETIRMRLRGWLPDASDALLEKVPDAMLDCCRPSGFMSPPRAPPLVTLAELNEMNAARAIRDEPPLTASLTTLGLARAVLGANEAGALPLRSWEIEGHTALPCSIDEREDGSLSVWSENERWAPLDGFPSTFLTLNSTSPGCSVGGTVHSTRYEHLASDLPWSGNRQMLDTLVYRLALQLTGVRRS